MQQIACTYAANKDNPFSQNCTGSDFYKAIVYAYISWMVNTKCRCLPMMYNLWHALSKR